MRPANNFTGRTFGRLKVVSREGSDERGKATWKCACDCGNGAVIVGYSLTRGDTQSCGCLVGLVAGTRPSALYGGLTLIEHAESSGIPFSTLYKRVRKYGEPFPPRLSATRDEQERRVFEQDRENNRRSRDTRMGAAAAWHRAPCEKATTEPQRTTMNATAEHLQPAIPAQLAPPPSLFNTALTLHRFQQAALQKLTQYTRIPYRSD